MARSTGPATMVAHLAGTDAKLVFVVRHADTIGSRNPARKGETPVVAVWRRMTCSSVLPAEVRFGVVVSGAARAIENNGEIGSGASLRSLRLAGNQPKNHVQTKV